MMRSVELRTSWGPRVGLTFDWSTADSLCHRSFFSYKDNTLNVRIINNNLQTHTKHDIHRYESYLLRKVEDWSMVYQLSKKHVFVFSSHPFWTSMDVPAGVTQEEGHTGFLIHLPSAVRALIFVARRIQPFLSLVDREVEFCVLTNSSFSTRWAFLFWFFIF